MKKLFKFLWKHSTSILTYSSLLYVTIHLWIRILTNSPYLNMWSYFTTGIVTMGLYTLVLVDVLTRQKTYWRNRTEYWREKYLECERRYNGLDFLVKLLLDADK